jgi:multicomponent Na+:H+ antiporter subunit B
VTTVITRTAARVTVPIILVVSVALFVQGHNMPGGGFIGGVLTATAFALIYVAFDARYLEAEILDRADEDADDPLESGVVADYRLLLGLGLAVAAGSGLAPILFELPFLSQDYWILHHVPLYGEVELASAVAFDLGVYLTVVGALLTILGVVGGE